MEVVRNDWVSCQDKTQVWRVRVEGAIILKWILNMILGVLSKFI
jgi:hypothetical protein